MYLSDRDLKWAIETGRLIVDPPPESIDATSIDLHLDHVSQAKIWNVDRYQADQSDTGVLRPELRIAQYNLGRFSGKYLTEPPVDDHSANPLVFRRGEQIVIRPGGFLLWQTREVVGTPEQNADLICFVDGKSTRARAGIVVHLTAPTIHATWKGRITLEIGNLGPFDIVLEADDVIAQLTVCRISSPPQRGVSLSSATFGQNEVGGQARTSPDHQG